ncbi:MAG TPA: hypothetical protein ENI64_10960 [Gammaproteobacteria bacterium]|nr:hypothetical protein [Gammaproteobacteria bacterium]
MKGLVKESTVTCAVLLMLGVSWSTQAISAEKSDQAAVSKNMHMAMPGDPRSHEFAFGQGKVLLDASGGWTVDAWIHHAGLFCGTYRIGVQFGVGTQGCQGVSWLEQPVFVTRHKQCNNAITHHSGFGETPGLADQFKDISCARRIVRCSGKCAASSGNFVSAP